MRRLDLQPRRLPAVRHLHRPRAPSGDSAGDEVTQHRKHRGFQTQAIVARYLAAHGWPYAMSAGAGREGSDITGVLDLDVECKARTGFSPLAAIKQMQARRRTGALPFAVLRMDGTGETTIDDWPCVIRLEDLVALLREAGYGDTP